MLYELFDKIPTDLALGMHFLDQLGISHAHRTIRSRGYLPHLYPRFHYDVGGVNIVR